MRPVYQLPKIKLGDHGLAVQFGNEDAADLIPYTWLRDSDPQLIHPSTRQKLHSSIDVPLDSRPLDVRFTQNGTHLGITWETNKPMRGFDWPLESEFSLEFLRRHSEPDRFQAFHQTITPITWTRESLRQSSNLFLKYPSLSTDVGLLRALEQLAQYGIVFVSDVPHEETSDALCELPRLAQHFGEIRETFYGRVWDVRSQGEDSRNIAYTNLDLGLHMDLEYFENPPRYQVLHMLRCRGVVGGESIFSDSLHAANSLRELTREAYDVLCNSAVGFHYINDNHHLYHEHTTIERFPPVRGSDSAEIRYINYSPPFQSPLPLRTARELGFLPALRKFGALVGATERVYEIAIPEGVAVIFDNRRVLHGRRGFRNAGAAATATASHVPRAQSEERWLKGCYIEADGVMDRLRSLRSFARGSLRD